MTFIITILHNIILFPPLANQKLPPPLLASFSPKKGLIRIHLKTLAKKALSLTSHKTS